MIENHMFSKQQKATNSRRASKPRTLAIMARNASCYSGTIVHTTSNNLILKLPSNALMWFLPWNSKNFEYFFLGFRSNEYTCPIHVKTLSLFTDSYNFHSPASNLTRRSRGLRTTLPKSPFWFREYPRTFALRRMARLNWKEIKSEFNKKANRRERHTISSPWKEVLFEVNDWQEH